MRGFVIAIGMLVGCAHVPLTASPETLAAHAVELASRDHVEIAVNEGGTATVRADDLVSVLPPPVERPAARGGLWGALDRIASSTSMPVVIARAVACRTVPGATSLCERSGDPDDSADQLEQITIGNLVAGCRLGERSPSCLADRTPSDAVRVGTRRRLDPTRLAIGLFGAATTAVAGACLAICHDHGGDGPQIGSVIGTVLGAATMVASLTTVY